MNSQIPKFWRPARQKSPAVGARSRKLLHGLLAGLATGLLFILVAVAIVIFASIGLPDLVSVFADEPLPANTVQRPIGEMRRDVEAFLKNSKTKDNVDLQVGGIVDLCFMHQEIVADPRFSTNRQLQSMRAVAADRLKKYLKTIEIEKARKARRLKKEQIEETKKLLAGEAVENPASNKPGESTSNPLASPNSPSSPDSPSGSEISDADAIDELMYSSMSSLGNLTGGPSQLLGYLPGHYAPPWDHGEELVNLIENTINPEFWQRNGGSGIIYYYRPSRIIVVGATSQVQDDLTNMLRNLRRLSR